MREAGATEWRRTAKIGDRAATVKMERIGRRERGRDASITFNCGSQIVDAVPVKDAGILFAGE